MSVLVSGILAYDFWSIAGNTAPAASSDNRVVNPYRTSVRQHFIPGGLIKNEFKAISVKRTLNNID